MNRFYDRNLAFKYVKEAIDDGLSKMGNAGLDDQICDSWIAYSQKILELTTKDDNPSILLNYLRIITSFSTSMKPYQKMSACLEYLIGILKLL